MCPRLARLIHPYMRRQLSRVCTLAQTSLEHVDSNLESLCSSRKKPCVHLLRFLYRADRSRGNKNKVMKLLITQVLAQAHMLHLARWRLAYDDESVLRGCNSLLHLFGMHSPWGCMEGVQARALNQ